MKKVTTGTNTVLGLSLLAVGFISGCGGEIIPTETSSAQQNSSLALPSSAASSLQPVSSSHSSSEINSSSVASSANSSSSQNNPPPAAFTRLEAEDYSDQANTMLVTQDSAVGYFDAESYIAFNNVAFGLKEANSIRLSMAKDSSGGQIDVRLNNINGPVICEITPSNTNDWTLYTEQTFSCETTTGLHDIYFVGVNGSGIANIDYFYFMEDGAPSPATQLSATTTEQGATLSWFDNANNETAYSIYYSTGTTQPTTPQLTLPANTTHADITALTPGTSYTFWVAASNTIGAIPSAPVTVTTLGTPPNSGNKPALCIFDYDLTLSSHQCAQTQNNSDYFCRTNSAPTYGWFEQCLGVNARAAIAKCVANNAYIGIASHAPLATDYNDKVAPIVSQNQFPEFLSSTHYANANSAINYPAIDNKANWNCDNCAYHMDPNTSKPEGIQKIMRHYGLNPDSANDRARVIFWDDSRTNISAVAQMGDVNEIFVPRRLEAGDDGGCGITTEQIEAGWNSLPTNDTTNDDDFVLMVVPDTQFMVMDFSYKGSTFGQYTAQTQWIAAQKDPLNIKFVAHVGDVVDHADLQNEWASFKTGWADIENAGLAWSIAPGNHDTDLPLGADSWNKFNQEYPVSHFEDKPWFIDSYPEGRYENNLNFFEAGNLEFMLISIGYGMNAAEYQWANQHLKANPGKRAIISTHDINHGDFVALAKENPNVFLMISGHYCDQEWHNVFKNNNGQDVHEIMSDYQCDNNGVTRYYQFRPSENTIEAVTYNPLTNEYWMGPSSRFTWSYPM